MIEATCSACGTQNRVSEASVPVGAKFITCADCKARVAINVSPRHFLDYRFVGRLEELLREYQLPAHCLEIELTESVLQTGAHTIKTLDQLREGSIVGRVVLKP